MKRLLYCALISLVSAVIFSGCGKKEADVNVKTETAVEYTEGKTDFNPDVDDAEEIINEAMKVYSWFETDPLAYDEEGTTVFKDDKTGEESQLYRVIYSNLNTEENLRIYLKNYFSDEIVDELIGNGMYKTGKDNYLYTSGEPKSAAKENIQTEYRTVEVSDDVYVYEVDVAESETGEFNTYRYEYARIDGKWVFIEFYFIL